MKKSPRSSTSATSNASVVLAATSTANRNVCASRSTTVNSAITTFARSTVTMEASVTSFSKVAPRRSESVIVCLATWVTVVKYQLILAK